MKTGGASSVEKGKESPTQHLVERHLLLYESACWRQPVSNDVYRGRKWVPTLVGETMISYKIRSEIHVLTISPWREMFILHHITGIQKSVVRANIYPHFRIEDEISQVPLDRQVRMPSMMLRPSPFFFSVYCRPTYPDFRVFEKRKRKL